MRLLLLLIIGLVLFSCSKEDKINIRLPFVTILKRASLDTKYPYGFLQIGVMFEKEGKGLINDEKDLTLIKSIKIVGSKKSYEIEKRPYGMINPMEFSGYIRIGEMKQYLFIVSDLSYNKDEFPEGVYRFLVEDKNGNVSSQDVYFNKKERRLYGFPEKIKVNQNTLEVSWVPTKNQTSYRIYIFKGEKGIVEDWGSLYYDTSYMIIPTNRFTLPKDRFAPGKYYVYVESYNPPYFNLQDRDEQIGYFEVSGKN